MTDPYGQNPGGPPKPEYQPAYTPPPGQPYPGAPAAYQPGRPYPGAPGQYPGAAAGAPGQFQPAPGQPYSAGPDGVPPGQPYPGYPVAPPARPGMVTAAAVLAFVWGAFSVIASLILAAASSVVDYADDLCAAGNYYATTGSCDVATVTGTVKFLAVAMAIVAGLLIWGGVVALSGRTGRVLVIAAGVYALLTVVLTIAYEYSGSSIAGLVVPGLIIAFLLNAQARDWFRVKGGTTF